MQRGQKENTQRTETEHAEDKATSKREHEENRTTTEEKREVRKANMWVLDSFGKRLLPRDVFSWVAFTLSIFQGLLFYKSRRRVESRHPFLLRLFCYLGSLELIERNITGTLTRGGGVEANI